ncbi:MAG: CAP domain-containing protein [Planctomycetes bacterium]|nr:CAP domain-containing protein [Planctomycetota bacterium]
MHRLLYMRRTTLIAAAFVLGSWTASVQAEEPAADLDALLAKAKSDDAAQRLVAYDTLRKAGPNAAARLAVALDPLQRTAIANFTRLINTSQAKAEAAKQTAALDAARRALLAFVFDEKKYPEESHNTEGQPEANKLLEAIEAAWAARREKVLTAAPDLAKTYARAQEQAAVLASLARTQAGGLPRCFELNAIFERAVEPERLAAWPALGQIRFGRSNASAAERAVLLQVNRYRVLMGLPVLRFDDRLHRAATWYAKECFEKNLRTHFCDTPGKKSPDDRALAEGHKKCVGEAIAFSGTPVEDWLHSAPHHRVLADKQSSDGAVAICANVAVLMTGADDPPTKLDPSAAATAADKLLWEDMARAVLREEGAARARGLERLARYLTGLGQKKPANEVWRELVRLEPDHAEARAALSEFQADGRWTSPEEKARAAKPGWPNKVKLWAAALLGKDEPARRKALAEIAEADATELTPVIVDLADPQKTQDRETLRAAIFAAVRLALPGMEARALELAKSGEAKDRWFAAEILEACGGPAAIDLFVETLQTQLSEDAFIRAVETVTGHRTRMHFGDDQPAREVKAKALKDWWAAAKKSY